MAKYVRVLREYNIPGHGSGAVGQERYVENESFDYLMQYDVDRPLIEEIEGETADDGAAE